MPEPALTAEENPTLNLQYNSRANGTQLRVELGPSCLAEPMLTELVLY